MNTLYLLAPKFYMKHILYNNAQPSMLSQKKCYGVLGKYDQLRQGYYRFCLGFQQYVLVNYQQYRLFIFVC